MNEYKITEYIGEGAHGHVLKAYSLQTNRWVALKKIRLKNCQRPTSEDIIRREVKILLTIDCKYVMRLLDYFSYDCGVVLVFEYMPTGLWEILHDLQNPPGISTVKTYMQMLLKGVCFLHDNGIMHRDLKPANLLISYEGILRIADLGLSRMIWPSEEERRPYTPQIATRWYRAPELLYGSRFYDQSVDLWALGCIFAEMITRTPLFAGENDIEQLAIIVLNLGTPTTQIWPTIQHMPDYNKIIFPASSGKSLQDLITDADEKCVDLIRSLLHYDGNKRITARKALHHEYFLTRPLPLAERYVSNQFENHRKFTKSQFKTFQAYENYFNMLNSFLN